MLYCFFITEEVAQQTGNERKMCLSSADTRGSTVKSAGQLMTIGALFPALRTCSLQKNWGLQHRQRDLKPTFFQPLDSTVTEINHVYLLPSLSEHCFVMCVITRLYFLRCLRVVSFFFFFTPAVLIVFVYAPCFCVLLPRVTPKTRNRLLDS